MRQQMWGQLWGNGNIRSESHPAQTKTAAFLLTGDRAVNFSTSASILRRTCIGALSHELVSVKWWPDPHCHPLAHPCLYHPRSAERGCGRGHGPPGCKIPPKNACANSSKLCWCNTSAQRKRLALTAMLYPVGIDNTSIFGLVFPNIAAGCTAAICWCFTRHCCWHRNFQLSTSVFSWCVFNYSSSGSMKKIPRDCLAFSSIVSR